MRHSYHGSRTERIDKAVEAALGDREICDRCKATFQNWADLCTAPLGEECPGFKAIDDARRPIVARVYGFRERRA